MCIPGDGGRKLLSKTTSKNDSTIVSLAFWLDLRGYGATLNRAHFDPTCLEAKFAIERLRRFQEVVARHSKATFPTLVINDGAVAYRDAGLKVTDRVWPFIERCWDLYQAAMHHDRQFESSGLRGVLAVGMRARGSNRGIIAQNNSLTRIINDVAEGRLSQSEATKAALRVRRVHDIVPQLQANFAFSRAYTAEQGASAGKLEGSRFYLETRVFRDGIPSWMNAGEPVHWKPLVPWLSSLATTFVEVRAIRSAVERENAFLTGSEMLPALRNC